MKAAEEDVTVNNAMRTDAERNEQRLVLLSLLDALDKRGSWCGETHIQKCAFFLQDALGVPLNVDFVLYKHGPFSFDLRQALGELRGSFLIDTTFRLYPYGPSLTLSDSGCAFLRRHRDAAARYSPQIDFVADKLSTRPVVDLERLGTALLIKRQEPELDPDARAARMTELKPYIKPELARAAVDEVEQLLGYAARQQVVTV